MELCHGEYGELKGAFTLPSGASMLVKHLKGYTEDTLKKHVEGKGGPDGLVPGWLEEHQLWRYLRGYVSPTITKMAKIGDGTGSGSGSGSSSSASSGKRTCFLVLYFQLTFRRSLSS